MNPKNRDTTYYICAAVHSDKDFCNEIIKEVFEEKHRVVAKSYGIDLSTVVKNCLAARERRDARNLKLALLLLVGIIFSIILKNYLVILLFYLFAYVVVYSEFNKSRMDIEYIKFKTTSTLETRLQEIANEQKGNVIIYGGFSPFVGAGSYINGWSFSVNINKGKKEGETVLKPSHFEINEINDNIRNSLIELNLDNLIIEDNLHINGQKIRHDKRFLNSPLLRPRTLVEPQLIRDFMEKPTHTIRHYKCIRITDWNGELILSIFLRFVKIGQNLFTEASYFLLTPLRDYYDQFDNMLTEPTDEDSGEILEIAGQGFRTIFLWLLSPFEVFHRFNRSHEQKSQERSIRHHIKKYPTFNYGATTSLREGVSYPEYRQYFQKLDQEMYLKIIERQIIDSIKNFLENKNVDTSDFEQARSTILNHGVIVSGGSIEAKNLAVGKNAKSIDMNTPT